MTVTLLMLLAALGSCSRRTLPPAAPAEGVGRLSAPQAAEKGTAPADRSFYGMPVSEEPAYEAAGEPAGEDVDLTELNAARLYAAVGTMNGRPEEYDGETIRLAGLFSSEVTSYGRRYYCSVPDAAGCCLESFELRPAEAMDYPADFPGEGAVVTVSGVFRTERISDYYLHAYVGDARLLWREE